MLLSVYRALCKPLWLFVGVLLGFALLLLCALVLRVALG